MNVNRRCILFLLSTIPLFAHAHWDSAYYHDSSLPGSTVQANWMKDLSDFQSIMQVSIPGTHDSASRYGGPYVQTQTMDIPTQLRAGIRFLDIRLKPTNGSLAIHHGVVYQKMMFGNALSQVKRYLKANPTEFVLMRVKEEESRDPDFHKLVKAYMDSPLYSDVIWRRNPQSGNQPPRVGDVRGKLVILYNYEYDATPSFGMTYGWFDKQDKWEVHTNWDLYGKWEKVKNFLDYSQQPGKTGLINYLVGSNIAFPYFVASGHSSPGTSAPRLATGLTTPGWSWKWQDFPRVNCFIGICTIAFEGTNVLTRTYIDKINKKNAAGTASAGGDLSGEGYLSKSAYVGIIVADFPGPGLIESVVRANRFYGQETCDEGVGCVEYQCPEFYVSPNGTYGHGRSVRYRSRTVFGAALPQLSYLDTEQSAWNFMGPFKSVTGDGFVAPGALYYRRTLLDGQEDMYVRKTNTEKACFIDGGNDPVWQFKGTLQAAKRQFGVSTAVGQNKSSSPGAGVGARATIATKK